MLLCKPQYYLIEKNPELDKNPLGSDILDNQIETQIYSTFDEKIYYVNSASSQELNLIYETEDYISSMTIDPNLEMVFFINYKAYEKKWSYDLKCVSLKKE